MAESTRLLRSRRVGPALLAGVVASIALLLGSPQDAGAGTTCANKFHFHGSSIFHYENGVYPYGTAWRWIWYNQANQYIGTSTCGSP